MDRTQFYKHKEAQPIFRTTRELTVQSFIWRAGSAPSDEQTVTIPMGSLLRINGYSAYTDGFAMSLYSPREVFKGAPGARFRFFNCPYDAMSFVRYEEA